MKRSGSRHHPAETNVYSRAGSMAVAVAKTGIDFGAYNAGFLLLGLGVIPAHLVSATLAILFNFLARKTHIFGSASRRARTRAAVFVLVSAVGMYGIQTGMISLLVFVWQVPLELFTSAMATIGVDSEKARVLTVNNGAKLVATIFSVAWNYLVYRYIILNDNRGHLLESIGDWFADHRHYVALGAVLMLAAVFRFWQLDVLPPGIHIREAAGGLVSAAVAGGDLAALQTSSAALGAPFYMLQAPVIALLGNTVLALRIVPALLGVAAVLCTYMAAHAWFSRRVAFVAAFLMASAPWAVHLSRVSDYAALTPVLVSLAMWAVARAIRTNKALWYVATGGILGGLWYTGIPAYVWAMLVMLLVIFARRYYRDRMKYSLQPILIVLLTTVLVSAPLAVSGVISGNVGQVRGMAGVILASVGAPLDTAAMLFYKTMTAAGMFHISGDQDILYNLPGAPLLNGLAGVLLVLGVLLALRRFRDIRYAALLAIGASVFLVNLFGEAGPASVRGNAAMLPVVYILASIGLIELFARWRGVFPRNVVALQLSVIVILAVLGLSTFHNWQHYFVAWANTPETYEAYREHLQQAARYMNEEEFPGDTVVIVDKESGSVLRYLVRTEYTTVAPEKVRAGVFGPTSRVIIPRYEATGNITLPDWNETNIHSSKRPNTILYTVYTR